MLSKPHNTEQDHLTAHSTHLEHFGRDGGRVGLEPSLSGFFGVKSSSYSVIYLMGSNSDEDCRDIQVILGLFLNNRWEDNGSAG